MNQFNQCIGYNYHLFQSLKQMRTTELKLTYQEKNLCKLLGITETPKTLKRINNAIQVPSRYYALNIPEELKKFPPACALKN